MSGQGSSADPRHRGGNEERTNAIHFHDKQANTVKEQPPDLTLYDEPDGDQVSIHLRLPIGPLLRVCKSDGPEDRNFDSYFLVIDRKKSKEIDWKQTPYLKVTTPWAYPTDKAGSKKLVTHTDPVDPIERSFLDTAIKACIKGESNDVLDCFIHQVSEYRIHGVDRKPGFERFKAEIEKFKAKTEEKGKKPT
ncbi:MAG: hypothetical protein L6R38_008151 [Xanthoria sp. 2 TBL-2021]|nr:MAG: hypothetical protein L6R38_008151 [Xanthoria sp. 2 TBL-2021]